MRKVRLMILSAFPNGVTTIDDGWKIVNVMQSKASGNYIAILEEDRKWWHFLRRKR